MPAKAGTSIPELSAIYHERRGVLGRPIKSGDDTIDAGARGL